MTRRNTTSRLFIAAVAALAANTAAANDFSDERSLTPAQRLEEVGKLRREGELDVALSKLDALRAEFPHDVDYVLARAQILSQSQRDTEALEELSIATTLAPDYEDVWQLRFRLLDRSASESATAQRAGLEAEAARRFPKATWWQTRLAGEASEWMLFIGAGHENLSNGLPDWDSQFVEIHFEEDAYRRYRLRLGRDVRYAEADISIGLGAEHSWESGWFAGLDAASTRSPAYQPEFGYSGHVGKTLSDGWVVDLRYRQRAYTSTRVGAVVGTVEKYYGDYRFAYGLGWSRLQGTASFANHVATVNWYYGDRANIGLSVHTGNEAESLENGQVLETSVRGITLSGHREISRRVGLQWWLGLHDQGDYYRRRFVGLAFSIRL